MSAHPITPAPPGSLGHRQQPQAHNTRLQGHHPTITIAAGTALVLLLASSIDAADPKSKGSKSNTSSSSSTTNPVPTPSIPLPTTPICQTFFSDDPKAIDNIIDAYEHGPAATLQTTLRAIADKLSAATTPPEPNWCSATPLTRDDRISFVFIDDHLPQPTIVRVLAGTHPPPSPASIRLLRDDLCTSTHIPDYQTGCSLYTIYLYKDSLGPRITSTYAASPTASPQQTGLAQAISSATAGIGGFAVPLAIPPAKAAAAAASSEEFLFNETKRERAIPTPLTITDLSVNLWMVGTAHFISTMTISGGTPPYHVHTKDAEQCLPPNLTMFQSDTTILIAGTPTHAQRKPYQCTVTVTDSKPSPATFLTKAFEISIDGPQMLVTRTVIPSEIAYAQISANDTADLRTLTTYQAVNERVAQRFIGDTLTTLNKELLDAAFEDISTARPPDFEEPLRHALKAATSLQEAEEARTITNMYAAATDPAKPPSPDSSNTPVLQTSYTFGNRTTVTFGLSVGAVIHTQLNDSVTISSGTLVENPPNGVMTSVNVYWAFLGGYDETTITPTCSEKKPRLTAGIVLTPDVGGFVGFAIPLAYWPLTRSLSVNLGYAIMVANVPVGNAKAGDTGAAAVTRRGAIGGFAAALGYSF
jgi:hypothetical protein